MFPPRHRSFLPENGWSMTNHAALILQACGRFDAGAWVMFCRASWEDLVEAESPPCWLCESELSGGEEGGREGDLQE